MASFIASLRDGLRQLAFSAYDLRNFGSLICFLKAFIVSIPFPASNADLLQIELSVGIRGILGRG